MPSPDSWSPALLVIMHNRFLYVSTSPCTSVPGMGSTVTATVQMIVSFQKQQPVGRATLSSAPSTCANNDAKRADRPSPQVKDARLTISFKGNVEAQLHAARAATQQGVPPPWPSYS